MLTQTELLQKYSGYERVRLSVRVKKIDSKQQIVTGEVYGPMVIDSHGEMMEAEDVQQMAHLFMAQGLNDRIDIMHDNKAALASAVESWISFGHPDYTEGAWVMSTKIYDKDVWAEVEAGKLNGYSFEAMVRKVDAIVELDILNRVFGITEENDGHTHVFHVKVSDEGRVIGGTTSKDRGHVHDIYMGTATEMTNDHAHRYFLG